MFGRKQILCTTFFPVKDYNSDDAETVLQKVLKDKECFIIAAEAIEGTMQLIEKQEYTVYRGYEKKSCMLNGQEAYKYYDKMFKRIYTEASKRGIDYMLSAKMIDAVVRQCGLQWQYRRRPPCYIKR